MNRFFITLCVCCISLGVNAHNPDLSSTLLVEQGDHTWVLQIRASLTAFEYEVAQHYGESSYTSPDEFQELLVNHVRENVSILFNDAHAAVLQNGMVKLGHETSVTFEVVGTPETIQSLEVKNSSFKDLARNQSALIVVKEGFAKDPFTLNNNNEHNIKLKVNDAKFVLVNPVQGKTQHALVMFAGALLALSIMYFAFKNEQSMRFSSPLQNA